MEGPSDGVSCPQLSGWPSWVATKKGTEKVKDVKMQRDA